ncbi:MAG: 4Fe-4S cluster-binding domain-containing protein [Thermodesulfobacteriota bacterium]
MATDEELRTAIPGLLQGTGYLHPGFGDLLRHDAVRLPAPADAAAGSPYEPVIIHLTVTSKCYARCKGCINAAITSPCHGDSRAGDRVAPTDARRDARAICNLAAGTGNDEAVLCFYGGEPLLAVPAMCSVMDEVTGRCNGVAFRYMLYTNGDLLGQTVRDHADFIRGLWLISVSIDGGLDQHDTTRIGTSLARIRDGLAAVRSVREGHVLMWSTLREEASLFDCYREFRDLYDRGLVTQFFWHWVETEEPFADLDGYLRAYERDLRRVMDAYLAALAGGTVLPLVHINELVYFALAGVRRSSSACGVELAANYDLIDGKIHSCSDLPLSMAIGEMSGDGGISFLPHDLTRLVDYKSVLGCPACGVHGYCGGRCPVQALAGSPLRLVQYCQLMRLHVGVVLSRLADIERAMAGHGLTARDLYDRSAVFAQFTDVTP